MPTNNCTNLSNTQSVSLTKYGNGNLTGFCHESLGGTYEKFIDITSAQLLGNMAAFTAGDGTPDTADQNKLWFKLDGTSCEPLGWHYYKDSVWKRLPSDMPTGMISPFGGATAPTDWLLCNGDSFDSGTYPDLATVLGDLYGDHSGTTYYLPDLQGRMPIGAGTGDYSGCLLYTSDAADE